ncbi:putative acetolactate synthase large subunit [Fusarium oxysporum f. sp. albedinis]|nr:putative acetolactate synthase large subunit [Fusarium oxysporum f. sp. albedinis]
MTADEVGLYIRPLKLDTNMDALEATVTFARNRTPLSRSKITRRQISWFHHRARGKIQNQGRYLCKGLKEITTEVYGEIM